MMKNRDYILVIDDDPDLLDAFRMVFESYGYTVMTASDAEVAAAIMEDGKPLVVIVDYLLSGTDGTEFCRKLKRSVSANLPVIIVSAHPDAGRAARAAGADCFVAKPFDIPDLIGKVEQCISGSRSG